MLSTGLGGDLEEVYLASAYMDIGAEAPPDEVEALAEFCSRNNKQAIVACDANAHCTVWGSPDTNERGKNILDFILRHNLYLMNKGSEPTFVTSWAQTIIDITLATSRVTDIIDNWHVAIKEISCADHRRIRFKLKVADHKPRQFRNPKKTNKEKYTNLLAMALNSLPQDDSNGNITPYKIEENVTRLNKCLMESYEAACPLKTEDNKSRLKKDKWWSKNLSKLRKKTRHHFNRAMNTKQDDDWSDYRIIRQKLKNEIKQQQGKSWKSYSSSIETESETARLKKLLLNDQQTKLGTLKKQDGSYTATEQEQCELLLLTHFPDCSISNEVKWNDEEVQQPTTQDWEYANQIVTEETVTWAISTFQPYKAPGTDEILPVLLQWGLNKIVKQLTTIYRACLAWRYIPRTWREVKVIFLPKPGKTDYTQPKSFRPISLTSFLLKTMERLGDRHIRHGPLVTSPIHNNQHAY